MWAEMKNMRQQEGKGPDKSVTFQVNMAQKVQCLCPCGRKVDQKTLRRHVSGRAQPQIRAFQVYGHVNTGSPRTPLQSLRKQRRRLAISPSTPLRTTSPGLPPCVKKRPLKSRKHTHRQVRPLPSPSGDILPLDPPTPPPIITGNDSPSSPLPQAPFEGSALGANQAEFASDDTCVIPPSLFSTPIPPRGRHAIDFDSDDMGGDSGSSKGDGGHGTSSDDEITLDSLLAQEYLVGDWEDINEDLLQQLELLGMWH
jgi:hypothetical protein